MSLKYQYYMSTASIHAFSLCNEFTVAMFGSNMVGAKVLLYLLQEVLATFRSAYTP